MKIGFYRMVMANNGAPRLPKDANAFLGDVLVECPRCAGLAHVLVPKNHYSEPSRLVCAGCGHTAEGSPAPDGTNRYLVEGLDPIFRLPLWLRENVGRHTVWAYNWRHYEDLLFFIKGDWRAARRSIPGRNYPLSFRTRYPQWMQRKDDHPAILRALFRMRRRRLHE